MIKGQVNLRNEAAIPVRVYDRNGRIAELEATVDTGFSGHLTLPSDTISQLELTYDRTETYTLGDNNDVDFDIYRLTLLWDGKDRPVVVLASESEPLVGMSCLRGYSICIDVIDGGAVSIAALS